jgi:AmiR/NasT family two-component response regulator
LQSIIVACYKEEDARRIRSILTKRGIEVAGIATTGAQVLSMIVSMDEGVVISTFRLRDMNYLDLSENLSGFFHMLLLCSPDKLGDQAMPDNVVYLPMPLKVGDLMQTLQSMTGIYRPRRKIHVPPGRSEEDRKKISDAKAILMERNRMTEQEAHRYLQKRAMDTGTGIVEIAEMVIVLASAQ